VYVLSLFMLGEKLDLVKVAAVLACLGGVVLLSVSDYEQSLKGQNNTHAGGNGTYLSTRYLYLRHSH
jgi:drug/metabolite transporter (DMT)-like permease